MEPLFYVMAIMGCGDGSRQCQQARVEPARYQSMMQCQADMPAALTRNSDLSFPEIVAACHATGERLASAEAPRKRG